MAHNTKPTPEYAGYQCIQTTDDVLHGISNPDPPKVPGSGLYWSPLGATRKVIVYIIEFTTKDDQKRIHEPKVAQFAPDKWTGHGLAPSDHIKHGASVVSRVAGTQYGSAKSVNVELYIIKRPGSDATDEDAAAEADSWVQALNKVTTDFAARHKASPELCGVLNLSHGIKITHEVQQAFNAVIDAGIIVVGAAGDRNRDLNAEAAAFKLPEAHSSTIVVGAVDSENKRAEWDNNGYSDGSDYGARVDIWCPGLKIPYYYDPVKKITEHESGTSQAAAIVTGIVATMLSAKQVEPDASKIKAQLKDWAFWTTINDYPAPVLRNGPAPEKLRLKAKTAGPRL